MFSLARKKKSASFVVIALLVAALICCFASPGIRGGVANALDDGDDDGGGGADNTTKVVYYNDLAQTDNDEANNFFFSGRDENGRNPYEQAEKAVNDGKVKSVRKWVYNHKDGQDTGELVRRTNPEGESYDPALLAAFCVDAEQRYKDPEKHCKDLEHCKDPDAHKIVILTDEQSSPIGRRADDAHKHFLKNHDYAVECYKKLSNLWAKAGNIYVKSVNSYTSAMYMWPDGLDNNKPSVILRDTENAGGHVIIFDFGEAGQLKYRIECGFQPINPDYWPVPDQPPVPDNPEPVPDEPEEPDEPEPEPYLEPKNPEQGYQHRHPDNPDVGGGPNHDSDTTVTPEPHPEKDSPDEYVPPAPPKADDDKSSDKPKKSDASSGTKSGSKTVDSDNGKKESGGTVVAGDGKEHGDMAKKVDEKPAPVEKGANPKDGGGNGECAPPE